MKSAEQIQQYIDNTKIKNTCGNMMNLDEIQVLSRLAEVIPFDAFAIAFFFGRARGYRIAKRETRIRT